MVQRSTRSRNRQLRKRLSAIENKLHQYGELGAEVALVIRFPSKESGYSYVTSGDFLERIYDIRSHVKTTNRSAEDVRARNSAKAVEPARTASEMTPDPEADAAGTPQREDGAQSARRDRFFPEPPLFDLALCRMVQEN
ncbi:uncharacterized protein EKO05_0003194 [Ascochyta rabiei]|uniref:uncharacterized protein n=1 Tax=Didymella rabiei TaxID=5454 RepID=UPI001900D457|nr:uncharacterized protein EKO05_0003194 [Ascochyta rabiei]UPX12653.1 hypothetical protein EKO05_0003194 [Ascochyta rabiei]